jgi:hypothetical protein
MEKLEFSPACHVGDHGFKSRWGRQFSTSLAQPVEQRPYKAASVGGSIPSGRTIFGNIFFSRFTISRLPVCWMWKSPTWRKRNDGHILPGSTADQDPVGGLIATATSVADLFEMLLEDGKFPGKGRSDDDKQSVAQWWEDRYEAIKALRRKIVDVIEERGGVGA